MGGEPAGMGNLRRHLSLLVVAVVVAASLTGVGPTSIARADSEVSVPTVTAVPDDAPGLHDHALFDSYYDLAPFGYEQQEYFVSGAATSDDGATTAPYTTRIIVFRPTASASFNGTVLLDWTNVTAQFENAVDTMTAREMLMRERFAFVHVSAQSAGVCCSPLTPKTWDPIRYASLDHPGDQYANDMFTQIAQAFRVASTPLVNGTVQQVIAAGQSQSGSKLNAYVVSYLPTHPDAVGIIDGIIVHGSASSGAAKRALAEAADALAGKVRVVHLLSDGEAVLDTFDPSPYGSYRLWEVAGTAHSDLFIGYQSVVGQGPRTAADAPPVSKTAYDEIIRVAGNFGAEIHPMLATCLVGGAAMPMHYAASTALSQLNHWVGGGAAPKNGPRFTFDPTTGRLATDSYGNTLGGIRMPPIDVPIARYRSTACPLGGITVPFTDVEIVTTYPTFQGYYQQMSDRTLAARNAGWLLPEDATDLMRRVCAAQSRWHPLTPIACPPLPADA